MPDKNPIPGGGQFALYVRCVHEADGPWLVVGVTDRTGDEVVLARLSANLFDTVEEATHLIDRELAPLVTRVLRRAVEGMGGKVVAFRPHELN